MKKRLLIWLAVAAFATGAGAQSLVRTDTLSVRLYFRQGYSQLEPDFRDNRRNLDRFVRQVKQAQADTLCRIGDIRIVASASPEGTSALNERLAARRGKSIGTLLLQLLPEVKGRLYTSSAGIDWQGLTALVEADPQMPGREEALRILRHMPEWVVTDGKVTDSRKRRLGMLLGGEAWRYMERNFFPELRGAGVEVDCEVRYVQPAVQPEPQQPEVTEPQPAPEVPADTVPAPVAVPREEEPVPASVVAEVDKKPFYMAVKTNLLYDAVAVPNVGVEFYLKRGWTLGANWMYAWWSNDSRHRYWRTYGGDVSIRKYLGRRAAGKPLTGYHLGVYGQLLTYDLEWGGRGYLGDKWSYGAGLEYGYSLPIARRLNLDFTLGIGYLGGEYMEYLPIDNHYVWQATKQRHWFGPTKLEVSLVWLLGRGNANQPKGGNQ